MAYTHTRDDPQRNPPQAVSLGTGKNVAAHPVAQLNNDDTLVSKPLQQPHRPRPPRTLPFHTIYDVLGKVVRATDANGTNIVNEYDRAGRVTKRCYTKPNVSTAATTCAQILSNHVSDDTPAVSFFYDGKGLDAPQTPNYAKGKLTKVTSSVSETQYAVFDNLGRVKETSQITNANTYTSKYTYNLSGALIEEEYPSGRKVKNEFESDGDIARIFGTANPTAAERTYANTFSYTPDGRIAKLRLGNGLWEAAKFNTRLRVTELALGRGVASGDVWKLGYEYGELQTNGTVDTAKNTGNIAKQTLSFSGLAQPFVQTYKYDSLYRLTEARETAGTGESAPQTWQETFGYDRYGNRIAHDKFYGTTQVAESSITDPTIDANTNRFQSGQGYTFDKNGNLTVDAQNRGFTFNADNKQIKVEQSGSKVAEYFYDGEGKRVKKKVYDPGNPTVVTEETIFVYSSGKLIAEYSTAPAPANPTTSWTVTDQLGSPRVIVNSLGAIVSRRDFMPFGEQAPNDASHRTANLYPVGDNIRQKFTGYEKDEETGLDFAEARMYENRHGRFTAVDPLLASGKSANPQTFNRYVYVVNSPLILTDPDGLQAGFQKGRVYINNQTGQVGIFPGKVRSGFARLNHNITTTTTVRGVRHHMSVTPNGWTIGDRVDGARFAVASPTAAAPARSDISAVAGEVVQGVRDGFTGIAKGIGNAPTVALNGITGALVNQATGGFYQGSNQFAVPLPFAYNNQREASYGSASSTGTLLGAGVAGGTIFGGSSAASVVPETNSNLTVFRVFGGDARAQGYSWTTTNPTTVSNFRNGAGLPSGGESGAMNTAEFMLQGRANPASVIESRAALPLDGNAGGLPELIIAPENVTITNFRVLRP